MLAQLPQADPGGLTVAVQNGIVTLAGLLGSAEEHDLIQVAGLLTWNIHGVVDVVNNLGITQPGNLIHPAAPRGAAQAPTNSSAC